MGNVDFWTGVGLAWMLVAIAVGIFFAGFINKGKDVDYNREYDNIKDSLYKRNKEDDC